MWVCGLKLTHTDTQMMQYVVTPYVGVWIETYIHFDS